MGIVKRQEEKIHYMFQNVHWSCTQNHSILL